MNKVSTLEDNWNVYVKKDLPIYNKDWTPTDTFNSRNAFFTGAAAYGRIIAEIVGIKDLDQRTKALATLTTEIEAGLAKQNRDRETV